MRFKLNPDEFLMWVFNVFVAGFCIAALIYVFGAAFSDKPQECVSMVSYGNP